MEKYGDCIYAVEFAVAYGNIILRWKFIIKTVIFFFLTEITISAEYITGPV